jgi:hypothetical protein
VNASRRRRTPASISASTCVFTFSTPASAKTSGAVVASPAPRVASSSTATLFTGANVSATRHASTPAGEVVDDRVEISAGPIEEADHRPVDVPHLVWPRRAAPLSASPDAVGAGDAASHTRGRGGTTSTATQILCRAAAREEPGCRSGRAGSRRRSPCRGSSGSRRASVDAARCEDMMTDRRGYTRCAVGATPETDSATDPETAGRRAAGDSRARDPPLVGCAPWQVRQADARRRA